MEDHIASIERIMHSLLAGNVSEARKRIAVKIVDDRGIESLKVTEAEE